MLSYIIYVFILQEVCVSFILFKKKLFLSRVSGGGSMYITQFVRLCQSLKLARV